MEELKMPLSDYLTQLKSKPPKDYALAELQLIVEDIVEYYTHSKDREERKILRDIYHKVISNYNTRFGKNIYNQNII